MIKKLKQKWWIFWLQIRFLLQTKKVEAWIEWLFDPEKDLDSEPDLHDDLKAVALVIVAEALANGLEEVLKGEPG